MEPLQGPVPGHLTSQHVWRAAFRLWQLQINLLGAHFAGKESASGVPPAAAAAAGGGIPAAPRVAAEAAFAGVLPLDLSTVFL
jgi:hypothetical protein